MNEQHQRRKKEEDEPMLDMEGLWHQTLRNDELQHPMLDMEAPWY